MAQNAAPAGLQSDRQASVISYVPKNVKIGEIIINRSEKVINLIHTPFLLDGFVGVLNLTELFCGSLLHVGAQRGHFVGMVLPGLLPTVEILQVNVIAKAAVERKSV